jgi:hypothetical protein
MAKAKTANKNNPNARAKAKDILYRGQKVKPVQYISLGRSFMAAQYEGGQLVTNDQKNVITWLEVVSSC